MGILLAALVAYAVGSFVFSTTVYAPAVTFGGPGMVHFKESTVASGTEPLLCFDAIVWHRLCPGHTFTKLSPANVSDRNAASIDLEPHQISTPMATGALPPNKCRTTKIPAGLAPGVWRLTGHATSTCNMAVIGAVSVTSALPDTLVTIKAAP